MGNPTDLRFRRVLGAIRGLFERVSLSFVPSFPSFVRTPISRVPFLGLPTRFRRDTVIAMRSPILIRFDDLERTKLERIAHHWGVSLAAAVRRLIREAEGFDLGREQACGSRSAPDPEKGDGP